MPVCCGRHIYRATTLLVFAVMLNVACAQQYAFDLSTPSALQEFFRYRGDSTRIISGHRGSHIAGYPENAIETFDYVLQQVPAFFEVDPRLTKDSVIVLLHDASLDRTTNGSGLLKDHTWEDVKRLKLKDANGQLTSFRIPTLQEAIEWARGKTVLNLDKKDVPLPMIADLIRKNSADAFVMVTVHNTEQALFYYRNNPNQMMSAHIKTDSAFVAFEASGLPWKNMIAYIGPGFSDINRRLPSLLHQRSVMFMISAAPSVDKWPTKEKRAAGYNEIFLRGADILESDFPIEVAEAVRPSYRLRPTSSPNTKEAAEPMR
ncbi:MAG: glycerophosphodiester phosphodiesterase family protein [Chitinophagaceae bacterium]